MLRTMLCLPPSDWEMTLMSVWKVASAVMSKTQAEPVLAAAFGIAALVEFLENHGFLPVGDARSRIPNLDPQLPAPAPATEQDSPAFRMDDGVGQEVAEDAVKQAGIAPHRKG